jgi:hypothetical protein
MLDRPADDPRRCLAARYRAIKGALPYAIRKPGESVGAAVIRLAKATTGPAAMVNRF